MGDQLARVFVTRDKVRHHEVNDAVGMTLLLVLEVESIVTLLDRKGFLVSSMTQDHLLQEHECALVMDMLSYLHLGLPGMRRVRLLTVITLQVLHHKFDLECLLKERVRLNFLLHGELDFNPTRVRLCPDE